jgi:hypothetical protein
LVFGGQSIQALAPYKLLYLPAAQAKHETGDADPSRSLKKPGLQAVQADAPK